MKLSKNPPLDRGGNYNKDIERWLECPVSQSVRVTLCDKKGNRRTTKIRRLRETCAICGGTCVLVSPHGEEWDTLCHECGSPLWEEVE